MREVRRVLKETIGNLEEKLDEVEKWKRAALQAECERMEAVEEMKRVASAARQQQQLRQGADRSSTRSGGAAGRAVQEEKDQEEVEQEEEEEDEEDEEEEEEEDDEDGPTPPPPPPKRGTPVRPPAKSPAKANALAAVAEDVVAAAAQEPPAASAPSYAATASTTRSSAASLSSIPKHPSATASSTESIVTQQSMLSVVQSPVGPVAASTAAFTSSSQSSVSVSHVTSHSNFQPSAMPPPTSAPLLPAAHLQPLQPAPTAVTVEVLQGTLNPQFFLFSPAAPPPQTFLSCHLPPSPTSFSALFGGHSPAYRLMCQLPLPADVKQRLVVALYAQVRGSTGGGGESAKVGELELDVQQAIASGAGISGTLQLWWDGDDKDSMSHHERLIATLPYSIRPATSLLSPAEESKQQLSYVDSYSSRVSNSPPASSSVRSSRRSSLITAAVVPKFTLTLTAASCSVVRLSRLQLRSQCSLSDLTAPLTALKSPTAPPSANNATASSHRLLVALQHPLSHYVDQLLRLHLSIDSVTASPVGYFDVPLRPLLADTAAVGSGVLCQGVKQQQWSAVHEPGSNMHIGSIEYELQWSVTAGDW